MTLALTERKLGRMPRMRVVCLSVCSSAWGWGACGVGKGAGCVWSALEETNESVLSAERESDWLVENGMSCSFARAKT